MTHCEIIIPYYQRESGILLRALNSIFAQTFTDYRIVIVDDGSPCSADIDIGSLTAEQQEKIHLIKQANTGQAGARNAALDACTEGVRMVAFLDSDDLWNPDHLERAVKVFNNAEIDFYWASVERDPAFTENYDRPSEVIPSDLQRPLTGVDDVFEVTSLQKVLCGQWFRHMHLSSTVISGYLASKVRFDRDLEVSEDFDFLRRCSLVARRCASTDSAGVRRAYGDNIWQGAQATDFLYAVEKYRMMMMLKEMKHAPQLDPSDLELLDLRIQSCRERFYWSQAHRLKGRMGPHWRIWGNWIMSDPKLLGLVASLLFKVNKNGGRTIIPGDDL